MRNSKINFNGNGNGKSNLNFNGNVKSNFNFNFNRKISLRLLLPQPYQPFLRQRRDQFALLVVHVGKA
jgi:hypothetical protein